MNAFGNFLFELRKEKGMTQAELATALGVTNKAVSKWETGEAMPETGLLLPIARIFGVTVDELLDGKRAAPTPAQEPPYDAGQAASDDETAAAKGRDDHDETAAGNWFTRGKDDEETFSGKLCGAICSAVMMCGIAVYLFLGGFADLWHPYWVLIPVCAFLCGVIGIVFGFFNKEKRKKESAEGKNPYIGGICGLIMLACLTCYLLLGALADLWHPYWFIVVIGAAACGILGPLGDIHKK